MPIPDFLKKNVLVFDTETAQLGDHVIEVGFSLFKNAKLFNESGTLIKPSILIDPGAAKVHNIYDRDVEDSPTFEKVAMWCYNILNAADVHCAYNYEYDRDIFEKEFERVGMKFPIKPMVDPFIFFKKWHKYNKGKRLSNAAAKYGIELVGAHRATNDATATGNILMKMAATRLDFPKTVPRLVSTQLKLIQSQYEDFNNYCKKMNREPPRKPVYNYYKVPL